jgi:hypothetical protein
MGLINHATSIVNELRGLEIWLPIAKLPNVIKQESWQTHLAIRIQAQVKYAEPCIPLRADSFDKLVERYAYGHLVMNQDTAHAFLASLGRAHIYEHFQHIYNSRADEHGIQWSRLDYVCEWSPGAHLWVASLPRALRGYTYQTSRLMHAYRRGYTVMSATHTVSQQQYEDDLTWDLRNYHGIDPQTS